MDENFITSHAVLLIDEAWRKRNGKGVAAFYVKTFPIDWGTLDRSDPTWEICNVVASSAEFVNVKSCLNVILWAKSRN